jgi:hypothetical protein
MCIVLLRLSDFFSFLLQQSLTISNSQLGSHFSFSHSTNHTFQNSITLFPKMTLGCNYWFLFSFILSTTCAILEAFPNPPKAFSITSPTSRRRGVVLGGNTATHATSPHSPSLPIIFSNDLCTVWQLSPDGQGPRICKLQMGSSYFFVSSGVKDIVDLKRHDVMGEQPTRTVRLSSKQRVSWMPFSLEGDQSVDNLLELEAFSIDPFNHGGAPAKQRVSWMPFSLEGDQSVDNLLELEAFSIDPFNGGAPAKQRVSWMPFSLEGDQSMDNLLELEAYSIDPFNGRAPANQRVSWMPFSLEGDQSVDNLLELEAFSIDPFNGGAPADAVYVMEIKSNFSREKRVEAAQFVSTLEEGLPPIASSNVGTSLLYSNSYLKVWDFIIAPGEICHLHRHTKNYFFLNLAKSTTQGLDQSGNLLGVPSVQKAGQVTFVDLKGGEAIHAVKNLGGAEFRQIIVELK